MKKNIFSKINFSSILKWLYISTLGLGMVLLVLAIFFLYEDVYLTIIQAQEIFLFKNEIISETINEALYTKVTKKLQEKNSGPNIDWQKIKNPFVPYVE